MKILIIISSHELNVEYLPNIKILNDYFKNYQTDYCGISNNDDFHNYEDIILFKYKKINSEKQLSKICNFINENINELNYDWYIKFRPEIKLLQKIDFNLLSDSAINARARFYIGPKKIKYGMSINGEGHWENINECYYDNCEKDIILDDAIYIFHNNVIKNNGFTNFNSENDMGWINNYEPDYTRQNEWFHSNCWKSRNIPLNIIGINLCFLKYSKAFSGNLNI